MIAVTGANGLLGSFIVRKLVEQGATVVALKRDGSDISGLADLASKIEWRTADVLNPVDLEESLRGVRDVIHTAALVSFNPSLSKKIVEINVSGTRNVVNAALEKGIRRFVHVSSVASLGRQKGQSLIDETNRWTESSLNSQYAESKYFAELEVFRAQEEGLNTVIINPSVILAPADWNRSSAQLFKYIWDERSYYIESDLNYVDVRDVANAASALLHHPVQAERFIINGGSLSFIDFFSRVAQSFGKRPPSIRLNNTLLRIIAMAETWRANLAGTDPILTKETARLAGARFSYSNEKIRKLLNFNFQPIDDTIAWCCSHYLNFIGKK